MLIIICFLIFVKVIVLTVPIGMYISQKHSVVGFTGLSQEKIVYVRWQNYIRNYFDSKIYMAGFEKSIDVVKMFRNQVILALIGLVLGSIIYCPVYGFRGMLVGLILGMFLCLYPAIKIERNILKRKLRILKELPSVVTNIAVVTDAGLNLQQAFIEVANLNKGEIASILDKVLLKVEMGKPLTDALEEIPELGYIEELNRVVSCMVQTLRKGSTGITKVLREQARQCWEEQKNKLKQTGQRASYKLFIPVYLLVFPAVGMLVITPAIMNVLEIFNGR